MVDKEVEQEYNDFWKGIVENEDGTLNKEQVKKELSDYSMVMDNCERAFMEMTDGNVSKANTKFFEVQYIFEDKFLHKESVKEDLKEIIENIDNLEDLKKELREYFDLEVSEQ